MSFAADYLVRRQSNSHRNPLVSSALLPQPPETCMPARKKVAKKKTARPKAAKRELIDTGNNKLYVRRNKRGTSFKEVEAVGRSLAQDRRRKAKSVAKRGQGDRGDRLK